MHKEVWRYGATKSVLRLGVDGVARIDVIGVVSIAALQAIRRDATTSKRCTHAKGLILDFRRAIVLLGASDVPMPAVPVPPQMEGMPVAYVVSELDEPLFLSHALQQARAGHTRAVFASPTDAWAWVVERANGTSLRAGLNDD